ncbi:MAG: UDP-N-acetylmuramate--L-alanine ligase [Anaerolineae bacterium]
MIYSQKLREIHLIGIGGAGLSAIATVLLEQGYTVSGSDLRASPTTERLARLGARVHIGHAAANLGEADLVVVSSAVPADNPELLEAKRRGVPVVKRAEWLGHMMAGKRGVAVAGTHGKTTTTAMIAFVLRDAGLDPTFIVGGDIPQLGTNAAAGRGDVFVIEADEYDHTFLGLRPEIAVVTVVEWDHPDCYPTPESMQEAFREFIGLVPPDGLVVACGDEPTVRELMGKSGRPAMITTYGLGEDNHWHAFDLRPNTQGGYDFSISTTNQPASQSSTAIPGVHNVRNALAALLVAHSLGVPVEQATVALAQFRGVARRFEIKGEAGGVLVVDDYAHHPTEIRATLSAARTHYPERKVWAVFQPHTYSRSRALLGEFATAFGAADHVILVDIFPAREVNDGSVTSRDILNQMEHPDARYIGALEEAAGFLADHLRSGDLLITLGAGDGYRVGEMVLGELGGRE